MKATLNIKIEKQTICVELKSDEAVVDMQQWEEDGNLSKTLLGKIDDLLKRNNLVLFEIDPAIEVTSDNESYTSTRIAKTVAMTIGYALTASSSLDKNKIDV